MTTIEPVVTPAVVYGSFPRRAVAVVIDSVILTLAVGVLLVVQVVTKDMEIGGLEGFERFVILMSIGQLLFWLYPALFESSRWQATPGKRLLGLQVMRVDGGRVGFFRALGRNLGRLLSSAILGIGYLMQLWTARRQTLHDLLAGCIVVRTPPAR